MWFMFGFVTLISFIAYSRYQYYKSNWSGIKDNLNGQDFQYNIVSNKAGSTGLQIGIDGLGDFSFRLKVEKWYDKLFKFVGLSVEHEVGMSELDKRVYIVSDDPDFLSCLSNSFDVKMGLLKLFKKYNKNMCSVKEVRCTNRRIWVSFKVISSFNEEDMRGVAKKVVPFLAKFKNDLDSIRSAKSREKSGDKFILKAAFLVSLSTALLVSGIIHIIRLDIDTIPVLFDVRDPINVTVIISLIVLVVFMFFSLLLLGRTSRTHLVLIEFLLIGSVGVFINTYVALREINMEYDSSSNEYVVVPVIKKVISKSKNGTFYYMKVRNWNKLGKVKQFRVSSEFYAVIQKGTPIEFVQRSGYLNYQWVSDYKKIMK